MDPLYSSTIPITFLSDQGPLVRLSLPFRLFLGGVAILLPETVSKTGKARWVQYRPGSNNLAGHRVLPFRIPAPTLIPRIANLFTHTLTTANMTLTAPGNETIPDNRRLVIVDNTLGAYAVIPWSIVLSHYLASWVISDLPAFPH